MDEAKVAALAAEWERLARSQFASAAKQADEYGRRFVEHGAVCYASCAIALREALGERPPEQDGWFSEGVFLTGAEARARFAARR